MAGHAGQHARADQRVDVRREARGEQPHLGADGKVILTPPCIFCIENH
jgi:hypothetical protein